MAYIEVLDLGLKDYKEVWEFQKILHAKRIEDKIPDTLILVEHNPVLTLGKSGRLENIKIPVSLLKAKGIDFYQVERGGDVTFHGPGQLVGYPIFNINKGLAGIRPFIEKIEDSIINTLHDFGISGRKIEKMIGVWIGEKKICSIGIAVKKWVSFHGFALNVNNDLSYFELINPCGFKDIKMTSMQEVLQTPIAMEKVKVAIIKSFMAIFNYTNSNFSFQQ
ncbi:MAG: lipoyl(octanoyl) transferase LipB [candidate division WOR-3 bacterium]|nr:lipoyl(octanoyl) transferase LipB [candidate division WOR-3 bacterium]